MSVDFHAISLNLMARDTACTGKLYRHSKGLYLEAIGILAGVSASLHTILRLV